MLEHQQSHTDNYRFRCSSCNKGFTRQSYYRDHKCPAAGSGQGTEDEAEEEEEVALDSQEKNGRENGSGNQFTRSAREGEDCSNGSEEQMDARLENGDRGGDDENCQAALSIVVREEQERDEDEEVDQSNQSLEHIQRSEHIRRSEQNCLQQPCL